MSKTILTIDDSKAVRDMVSFTLEPEGYRVVGAENGADGLEKLRAARPALVITDLNMPVMNGMQMIKALRALPAFMGTPIVFLTTESDDAVKQEAKAAGATGWITKPFKPEQLLAVVAKLVRA